MAAGGANKDATKSQQQIYSTFKPVPDAGDAGASSDVGESFTHLPAGAPVKKLGPNKSSSSVSVGPGPINEISERMCTSETSTPMNLRKTAGTSDGQGSSREELNDKATFEEVSDDMSQLVQHLNSIHNDISQLAKKNNLVYFEDGSTGGPNGEI